MFAPYRLGFVAMGSPCAISLFAQSEEDAGARADVAIQEVRRIEQRYSRYREDSLLGEINRVAEAGGHIDVDEETAELMDHAFRAYAISGGLFDVTSGLLRRIWNDAIMEVPSNAAIRELLDRIGLEKLGWRRPRLAFATPGMELDFGGLGKEYAADRAAAALRAAGSVSALVDLGGDIAVVGPCPDGSPWRIGVRDPRGGDEALATLFVGGGGIATSGGYERFWEIAGRRYGHALDPKSGWPVEGLPSITVAADSCLTAGITATIALLKGKKAPEWLKGSGTAHLFVDSSGRPGGSIPLGAAPSTRRFPTSETAP